MFIDSKTLIIEFSSNAHFEIKIVLHTLNKHYKVKNPI